MSHTSFIDSAAFSTLRSAAERIFSSLIERLGVQTVYVTQCTPKDMTILSTYSPGVPIFTNGYQRTYDASYCRLIHNSDNHFLSTMNLSEHHQAKHLDITKELLPKGFLGVTLRETDGSQFGTLSAIDQEEKHFTDEDISFMQTMADVLSYLIELDRTKYNMNFLNVPIIPITSGVAALTIQGIVDEERTDKIIQNVLHYSSEYKTSYFIVDLSGLMLLDETFPTDIFNLFRALQVMGVHPILTGLRPDVAKQQVQNEELLNLNIPIKSDLEAALKHIGLTLSTSH
ncbi:rsbT co-antagonist protein RsbR [Salsuginibacillus halophilus]|uniref:RsbT co-antagonist protein RsbR n=1 Tax=Salsuginibacillus halophilus TaxID=517424 RepID=A0A2P8HL14_9BACI|nr:STAS domain-containing protein [Salsuginibacillus halophilus]PSL46870.1 rsbT co-antagonist protein RsbR [Salsuginibacillus halophilus]